MFIITLDCYAPSFCFLKIKQTEHIYDNRYNLQYPHQCPTTRHWISSNLTQRHIYDIPVSLSYFIFTSFKLHNNQFKI